MRLSDKVLKLQESPIRKFSKLADNARERGVKIYSLNIGQPDIETPKEFLQSIRDFEKKTISYTNSQGDIDLIRAMKNYYKRFDIDFEEEDILVTNGGSEALEIAFNIIFNAGDSVIVPEPFYANYNAFACISDVKIKPLITKEETNFVLPSEKEIEALIDDSVRAILFSNPCNPTGAVYTKENLDAIAKLALKYDLFIIADEAYREFVYDGETFHSLANYKELEDRLIIVDSVSKRFSACGARIGNLASKNKEFMKTALKFAQARLCTPTLEQVGAKALYDIDSDYFLEILERYKKRRDLMVDALGKIPNISFKTPKGAFYIIVTLPVDDADDFVRFLLEDFNDKMETTLVSPAENFYASEGTGKNQIRIAYTLKREDLVRGIELIGLALEKYNK